MRDFEDLLVWMFSTGIYFSLRPFWIRNKHYFITAGVLFFTPSVVVYESIMRQFSIWPLILGIPNYLFNIKLAATYFVGVVVPTGAIVALIFWAIAIWRKI